MSLICTSVTTWVTQQVLKPVDTWVTQQQQQCKQYPWWDPRGWFCWIVTITIKVVVWVTQNILLPITQTVCRFITFIIGGILWPFGAAIDAVCQRCNATGWIKEWFLILIKFVDKQPSPTRPGSYVYTFVCLCNPFKKPSITIEAANDDEAAASAKLECEKQCS